MLSTFPALGIDTWVDDLPRYLGIYMSLQCVDVPLDIAFSANGGNAICIF